MPKKPPCKGATRTSQLAMQHDASTDSAGTWHQGENEVAMFSSASSKIWKQKVEHDDESPHCRVSRSPVQEQACCENQLNVMRPGRVAFVIYVWRRNTRPDLARERGMG